MDIPNNEFDDDEQEIPGATDASVDCDSCKRSRSVPLDDDDDDENSLPEHKRMKKPHRTSTKYKMQSPFQPGATPQEPGKETFLCYNMLGWITTAEIEGRSYIEVDFHDTEKGPEVLPLVDYYGFTMASINENGCVFANPCKGKEKMSVLMYQPFRGWKTDSEWKMRFDEGEEVKVVANGSGWVAAVTSLNLLRIYSEGGLQKHIISLDGPIVTAAGCKDQLAVVFHVSEVMEFRVFNISRMTTQQLKGRVALTPGSSLTWIGFSKESALSSYDSEGVLRVFLTSQYGGSWIPVFSCKEKKLKENYWAVGLNATSFYCLACERYPQVRTPEPIRTTLDLSLPLASSDLIDEDPASLENELMLKQLHSFETQRMVEEMALSGEERTTLVDKAVEIDVSKDKCILKLIASCCISDKLERAVELMRLFSLGKTMRGAIKLVKSLKLTSWEEKFNCILQEKLLEENKWSAALGGN